MFYKGIVVGNSSPDSSDRIEVSCPRLSQKFKSNVVASSESYSLSGIENLSSDSNVSGTANVTAKSTFTAYPLIGGGSSKSGSNLYPEVGDEVMLTQLDGDSTQLYYVMGAKKIEGKGETNANTLKLDFLDVIGISTIASAVRNLFKVLYKTLAGNSITLIDQEDKKGILIRSGDTFISVQSNPETNGFLVKTPSGYSFAVDEITKQIGLSTPAGLSLSLDENSGKISVSAVSAVNLSAPIVNVAGGGGGVITTESICPFTNSPHGDGSSKVFCGK